MGVTLALAVGGLVGFAPGSPAVKPAAAIGCWVFAHGDRSTDTSLWGYGELNCDAPSSLFIALQYQHCDFDIGGACFIWGSLVTFYSRNWTGTGYLRVPLAGTFVVGGLANEHLYHVRMAITGTIGGGFATGDNYTQQFRL